MKNLKITFQIIIAFISTIGYCQITYGVQLGINDSKLVDEYRATNGSFFNLSNPGFSIGLLANYNITDSIELRWKLLYNSIGDRERNYVDLLYTDALDYRLNYLSIPINIKFFSKPYVSIGPQVGFLISTKKLSEDFGEIENEIDLGGNITIGYELGKLNVEFGFYQGFTNIMEIDRGRRSDFEGRYFNVRNQYLSLNLIYFISD